MFLFLIISLYPCPDVLAQTFLIEPRLGTVEITYVEETEDGLVFRTAVTFHHQHVVFG